MKAVESIFLLSVCDEVIKLQLECCVAFYHLIFFLKERFRLLILLSVAVFSDCKQPDGIEIFS